MSQLDSRTLFLQYGSGGGAIIKESPRHSHKILVGRLSNMKSKEAADYLMELLK